MRIAGSFGRACTEDDSEVPSNDLKHSAYPLAYTTIVGGAGDSILGNCTGLKRSEVDLHGPGVRLWPCPDDGAPYTPSVIVSRCLRLHFRLPIPQSLVQCQSLILIFLT